MVGRPIACPTFTYFQVSLPECRFLQCHPMGPKGLAMNWDLGAGGKEEKLPECMAATVLMWILKYLLTVLDA